MDADKKGQALVAGRALICVHLRLILFFIFLALLLRRFWWEPSPSGLVDK